MRSISEIANNSRREETRSIASIDDPDVHDNTTVDFPVAENAFPRGAIEAVHLSVSDVDTEASDEECSFVVVEEFGGFGPVWDQPFGRDSYTAGDDALTVDNGSA